MDLLSAFLKLPTPQRADSATFSALGVPGYQRQRIGKSLDSAPALLISLEDGGPSARLAPVRLSHLSVQHGVSCRIETGSQTAEATLSVVRLVGAERVLADYFLEILPAVVRRIGEHPTTASVQSALADLVELFRSLGDPPRKSIQGLWAELFVLVRGLDPLALASAWHRYPEERFDFAEGDERIEVKSAAGRIRRHHFSLEQVCPPNGARVLIASLLLERATGGTSLSALLSRAREVLPDRPDVALAAERTVGASLGSALPEALSAAFDEELAASSLRFYWSADVPRIATPLPQAVTDVHFVADLSSLEPLLVNQLAQRRGLFSACGIELE